jgi:hypothetical protein
MPVDVEAGVEVRRLCADGLGRVPRALPRSRLRALLLSDQPESRSGSSAVVGEWARDTLTRRCWRTGRRAPWGWDEPEPGWEGGQRPGPPGLWGRVVSIRGAEGREGPSAGGSAVNLSG